MVAALSDKAGTARTLSDAAWADICAAAARHDPPLTPDAEARAELSAVLFEEYPNMRRPDRKRMAKIVAGAPGMLKAIDLFAAKYRQLWQPHRSTAEFEANIMGVASPPADRRAEAHIWSMKILRRYVVANLSACEALRRANEGHLNSQREWLVSRLCCIWLDYFHASGLGYSNPTIKKGPLEGPLIDYLTAAMRQIMPRPPKPRTLRDAIDREGKAIKRVRAAIERAK
jgi:hypothetical protein